MGRCCLLRLTPPITQTGRCYLLRVTPPITQTGRYHLLRITPCIVKTGSCYLLPITPPITQTGRCCLLPITPPITSKLNLPLVLSHTRSTNSLRTVDASSWVWPRPAQRAVSRMYKWQCNFPILRNILNIEKPFGFQFLRGSLWWYFYLLQNERACVYTNPTSFYCIWPFDDRATFT